VKLSERGAEFIANFEGFRPTPYHDVDHLSIGFGTRARSPSDRVDRAEGYRRLRAHVEKHVGPAVRKLKPFGQDQFDALACAGYNLGAGVLDPDGQIGRAVLAGDYRLAGDVLLNYVKADLDGDGDKEVLAGLVRRRQAERRLLLKVRYTPQEVQALRVVRNHRASAVARRENARWLRAQAERIQQSARSSGDWQKNDRGRRYQGIRRALRAHT
jgi:GH24 family phage-related lysozyme (muramidase)